MNRVLVDDDSQAASSCPAFLAGGGEMGALMRGHDWSRSPLGRPETWPQPLRATVGVLISSKFPMFVAWGDELGLLYNDAYADILGAKHPAALGRPLRDVWPEIWPDVSPYIEAALGGEASYRETPPRLLTRRGVEEQAWFTVSYSPVRDEGGAVAGVFCACTETTHLVLEGRRQAFWLTLDQRLRDLADPREIMMVAAELLGRELAADRAGYAEIDDAGETFTVAGDWCRSGMPSLAGRRRLDDFGPSLIAALRAGEAVAFEDALTESRTLGETVAAAYRSVNVRAAISAPLVKDGRLVAVIYAHQAKPRRWLGTEEVLVRDVGERTWAVVERARAEGALRESEARYKLALDAASAIGTWDYDVPADRVYADAHFARLFSVDPGKAAAGAPLGAFLKGIHPDDRARIGEMLQHSIASGEEFAAEYRLLRSDGPVRWMFARGRTYFDEDGTPTRFPGVAVDITDRKATEDALRTSEERLARALEVAQMGVWELDLTTQHAWRSLQHDRIFGYETLLPDWTYATFLDHVLPEDRAEVERKFKGAIEAGHDWNFECRIRRADGAVRWVWAQGRLETDGRSRPLRMKGIVRDVTARKQLEEELRRLNETLEEQVADRTARLQANEARLRSIFETSYQYQGLMTLDGTLRDANATSLEGIGAELHDVVGKPFWETPWFAETPGMPEMVKNAIPTVANGATVRQEIHVNLPRGGWRWFDFTIRPIRDATGAVVALVPEAVETTERRLAEEALRQSQKLEAVGQLTGGVAHDFNNLLTPIIGSLDMLHRRGVGGERERRLIDGALQSADRARTLVQRLLAFARRQPLQPVAVNVSTLIHGITELIDSTSGPQISVIVDVPEGLPPAKADPNQLEMAILNLSVNARDAMPDGGRLRIAASHIAPDADRPISLGPGEYIRVSVADTGTGMDAATLARAIEPFFSTKGVGRGTGLGLSTVHGLAAQLGGALTLESTPRVGTVVQLWLPVSVERHQAPKAGIVEAPDFAAVGTALLVDDEDLARESTADMLGEFGYEVVQASSAEDALRTIDSGREVAILVTDYLMPGMTGADLARAFQARRPGKPVLIVSGYAEAEAIASDLPRLVKPFRKADLAALLWPLVQR